MRNDCVRGLKSRRASARSMARLLVAPLVLALCLFGMVRTAYAEVNWEQKEEGTADGRMHAQVAPWDWPDGRMNALAEFLGYDWDSFSDQVKENILADEDVTLLRDKTKNLAKEYFQFDDPNIIEEFFNAASRAVLSLWNTLFGSFKIWDIDCTWAEYKRAQMVFLKYSLANNGGDDSGGSGGGGIYGDITEDVEIYYSGNIGKFNDADSFTYHFPDNYLQTANSRLEEFASGVSGEVSWSVCLPTNNSYILFTVEGIEYVWEDDVLKSLHNTTNGTLSFGILNLWNTAYSNGVINCNNVQNLVNRTLAADGYYSLSDVRYISVQSGSGGGGGGDYTPTPKPTPTRPDEPEIKLPDIEVEPSDYEYGDPSIHVDVQLPSVTVQPDFSVNDDDWDISVNVNLDPVISVSGGGTDVTSWLSKILEAINNLRQENRTDFNWLREQNSSNTNILRNGLDDFDTDVIDGMSLIYAYLGIMNSDIYDDLDAVNTQIQNEGNYIVGELREVLQGRFQWLAENINQTLYDFDDDMLEELQTQAKYIVDNLEFDADNSSLETWLKKIYSKLNSNPSGIPDVTADPDGWTDALEDLIGKLLEGLVGAANVAELAQMLNDLSDHFPISIPWDLLAIVTLFSGEPVTPQFDFPIYFGAQHITDISIDLTAYEEVGEVSRIMSLLLFACMLLMETKTLLNATTTVTRKAG